MPVIHISRVIPEIVRYDYTRSFNGTPIAQGPLIYPPVSVEISTMDKSWVRTPNFWTLRRTQAQLPDNSFAYGQTSRGGSQFVFVGDETAPPGPTRLQWTLSGPGTWWAVKPQIPRDLGMVDLYSRLASKARRSDFSLPITLIEAGRTASMVTDVARTLAGTIYDLRRGNLRSAVGRLGIAPSRPEQRRFNSQYGRSPTLAASNAWLQYQYGWKPLLNDVKNAAEAVAEAVSRNGDDSTTSVTASTRLVYQHRWPTVTSGVAPSVTVRADAYVNISRRAKWRFKPSMLDLPGLFGLVNPLEVVWEIVPFSFVADWFLPIGNYLSSLDLPLRFTHVGGSHGYRKSVTWESTPVSASFFSGNWSDTYQCSGSASIRELSVTRDPLGGPPVPNVSDLTFEAKINSSRAVSAIALLRQQASRLGR